MPKNFNKSPAAKRFGEVAKNTMVNTNSAAVQLIENSALIDYPRNDEDISYTEDIENSIRELGFTDPVEITDFGMREGEYMILSGHRRRAAGVKCGMDLFPCIIKSFDNDSDVQKYVLLANSQRNAVRDPLLYCRRYKMHEQQLKSVNFQGSLREEIAKRLGMSVQQADRYNQMNKIIPPVWELVRKDAVGMSGVLPMSVLNHEEQREIFEILQKSIDGGLQMTREKVKKIIADYKKNQGILKCPHREDVKKTSKAEKQESSGRDLIKAVKNLNNSLGRTCDFKSKKEAESLLNEMEKTFELIFSKYCSVGKKYALDEEVQKTAESIKKMIEDK